MKSIRLHEGKERSLLRHHPWVFQGSVDRGKADAGETVRVDAHDGRFLAWAAYSPTSQIRLRAWSFDEHERIDHAFFKRRIDRALALRQRLAIDSDGVRLIHGEADGLPGLIVDRYGDLLSAQFLSAGTERWKGTIADLLLEATGCTRLYERSDSGVRAAALGRIASCASWAFLLLVLNTFGDFGSESAPKRSSITCRISATASCARLVESVRM